MYRWQKHVHRPLSDVLDKIITTEWYPVHIPIRDQRHKVRETVNTVHDDEKKVRNLKFVVIGGGTALPVNF